MKENKKQNLAFLIKAKSNENTRAEYRNPKREAVSIIIPISGGILSKIPEM